MRSDRRPGARVRRETARRSVAIEAGRSCSSALQLSVEPHLCECPITLHGNRRDVQDGGGLLDRETAEEPQLDDAGLTRLEICESIEGKVERKNVHVNRRKFARAFLQRNPVTLASLDGAMRSGVIHENSAHEMRSNGKEVRAVLPPGAPLVNQLEVGLVNQGRRRKGVIGPLPVEIPGGQPT